MKSILMVEDSRFLRHTNERILAKAGYRVLTAADGEEALDIAKTAVPNLILLDMLLPKIEGQRVLRELRHDPATAMIPVIVLSSLSQLNEQKLKGEGAVAYFEKSRLDPANDPEALVRIVAEAFERRSADKTLSLARNSTHASEKTI